MATNSTSNPIPTPLSSSSKSSTTPIQLEAPTLSSLADRSTTSSISTGVLSSCNIVNAQNQHIQQTMNDNQNSQVISPNTNSIHQQSFAKALQKPNFYENEKQFYPTKEHGIIISSIKDVKIHEYIECIANIVGSENVMFASRLSMDRIGMYLKSKTIVETLTEKYNTIVINDIETLIRPLITKSKKFFLSRVSPIIPNAYLHNEIEKLDFVKFTSPIQMVKVGCEKESLSHVLSYRRIFYGLIDKNKALPEFIEIEFEGETHKIYINDQIKKCTICLKYGHLAEFCLKNRPISDTDISLLGVNNNDEEIINSNIFDNTISETLAPNVVLGTKLIDMDIDSVSGTDDSEFQNNIKKRKSSIQDEAKTINEENCMIEIQRALENSQYEKPVSIEQFKDFIKNISKCKYKEQIQNCIKISGLDLYLWHRILDDLYPKCSFQYKNKITRTQRKLKTLNQ